MTDIENQALALVNEVKVERGKIIGGRVDRAAVVGDEALCRALEMLNAEREAHAATRRDMSEAVEKFRKQAGWVPAWFRRFIIKPPVDPKSEVIQEAFSAMLLARSPDALVEAAETALAARGGRIVFDGGE